MILIIRATMPDSWESAVLVYKPKSTTDIIPLPSADYHEVLMLSGRHCPKENVLSSVITLSEIFNHS